MTELVILEITQFSLTVPLRYYSDVIKLKTILCMTLFPPVVIIRWETQPKFKPSPVTTPNLD